MKLKKLPMRKLISGETFFNTYAEINGKKPKTDKQIIKWLKNPHTDSAEYKMWGNGVALPCVVFVLSRIVSSTQEDEKIS